MKKEEENKVKAKKQNNKTKKETSETKKNIKKVQKIEEDKNKEVVKNESSLGMTEDEKTDLLLILVLLILLIIFLKYFLHLLFLGILLISMPLYIIFKSAESDELFTSVNNLKSQIEEQRKENEQLALNLQNQASLVKIEQDAKYRLGMQKIEPTRIIKVQTNEKDYIETENVSIIRDKEETVFDKIFKFLMNLF